MIDRRMNHARLAAVVVVGLLGLPAVAKEPPAGTTKRSLRVGDTERTYRLHRPPGAQPGSPLPLVLVLHGAGATGEMTEALTKFDAVADANTFVVAYPDGLRRLWLYTPHSYDVAFIDSLIGTLVAEKVADPKRVYATGISNGAYLSNRLACDLPDRIAAVAPVSGTILKAIAEHEKPGRAVPVLYFHGTEDRIVGYDGTDFLSKRESSLSAESLAAWWAKRNGCASDPTVEKLTKDPDAPTRVERWTYAAGDAGAEVVFMKIEGGGHTWPGGAFQPERLLGKVSREINASELIWAFFLRHTLRE
ncbi:MAG TPA: PHB depolymerase family esterase [Planctomycetota bacterium]|nr:PHB depolymerase family esterase [Planctomycetota bacterium]